MNDKEPKKKDLFVRTRRKLTWTYARLILLLLVLFSFVVSAFLVAVVYHEQRQNLQSAMNALHNGNEPIPDLANLINDDLNFIYVVDTGGQLVQGSEAFPGSRSSNLKLIAGWKTEGDDFRFVRDASGRSEPPAGGRSKSAARVLLLGAHAYTTAEGETETVYAAKEVTLYLELFKNLLAVLLAILVIFVLIVIWFSNKLSKTAMEPIQTTYRQQQQFLADASHELRTPLSVMNTGLDIIEMENGEDLTPYAKEILADTKEEVGRMSRMVQHLLQLARSDAESMRLQMERFDLAAKVRQGVQAFLPIADKKKIRIHADLMEELVIHADAERIKQVVYILLDNAVKYTSEGGLIVVRLAEKPKYWTLAVRDTGVGIRPEEKDRIFDRFYRADKHRSRDEGSAGLGLSIAKRIAEAHRGIIEVESIAGQGSEFRIRIPL